jgi:uncharacterized membrane protein YhdT
MKNSLYLLKWPLFLLLLGFLIRTFGAMIKILHWFNADQILIIGTALMLASIVWLMMKLVFLKKENS